MKSCLDYARLVIICIIKLFIFLEKPDVNGALNIMRKVVGDSNGVIQRIIDSGLLFNPVRVRSVFPRECLLLN